MKGHVALLFNLAVQHERAPRTLARRSSFVDSSPYSTPLIPRLLSPANYYSSIPFKPGIVILISKH